MHTADTGRGKFRKKGRRTNHPNLILCLLCAGCLRRFPLWWERLIGCPELDWRARAASKTRSTRGPDTTYTNNQLLLLLLYYCCCCVLYCLCICLPPWPLVSLKKRNLLCPRLDRPRRPRLWPPQMISLTSVVLSLSSRFPLHASV